MIRSIVLPAYNEAGYIAEMVARTIATCEVGEGHFEIVVVDNASTDATADIVSGLADNDARIRLIRHPENRLYAGSCRSGAQASRGDRVFILDSDGQHPPTDVWAIDAKLNEGNDLVFGWRRQREESMPRLAISRAFLLLAKFYLGYPLHDVNCGIRGMSRRFVDALEINHRVNMVNPELYVRAKQGGFSFDEVEVIQEARKAGVSSHHFRRLWRIFFDVRSYLRALRAELKGVSK